jgi:hypothetical protein
VVKMRAGMLHCSCNEARWRECSGEKRHGGECRCSDHEKALMIGGRAQMSPQLRMSAAAAETGLDWQMRHIQQVNRPNKQANGQTSNAPYGRRVKADNRVNE